MVVGALVKPIGVGAGATGREYIVMEIITGKNISKSYKDCRVLDNVNIYIPRQAIFGLFGPNGAGKSTLLKIISGISSPDKGEIIYSPQRTEYCRIGALIDSPALYPNLTAYENLKIRALLYGLSDSQIRDILDLVGIDVSNKKTIKKFSLGMKQRLGIACAILNKPELIILDEPTNGLDPIGIHELLDLIVRLNNQGSTILIATHSLKEVEGIITHVAVMDDGNIIYQDRFESGMDLKKIFLETIGRHEDVCEN